MVKLNFMINEVYLLTHSLKNAGFLPAEHKEAINTLFKIYLQTVSPSYNLFGRDPNIVLDIKDPVLEELLKEVQETEAYNHILTQTQKYQEEVKEKWLTNHDITSRLMQEITGLDFGNDEFSVYLTLGQNGRYWGDRRIVWGPPKEYFSNQTIVFLWHEIMHGKIKGDGEDGPFSDPIEHSVIQLATDNELRVRLNGGEYPPFVGHELMFPILERMLSPWRSYLDSPERNILEFNNKMLTYIIRPL
jgi:hypothetical protein